MKGQMEMLGIALVMVILVLGLVFLVQFSLKKPRQLQEQFIQMQLPQNMLNALVKTRTTCQELDMATVLQDCANNADEGGRIACAEGQKTCEYAQQTIKTILEQTVSAMEYNYRFTAKKGETPISSLQLESKPPCSEESFIEKPGIMVLPLEIGAMSVVMEVCR